MKKLFGLICALSLSMGLGSCIFVDGDLCDEGAISCDGEVIEQCVGDNWELVEDCFSLCGGYCDFDPNGEPVCIC